MKGWNLVPALLIFITFTTRIIEMESLEANGVVVAFLEEATVLF